MKHILGISLCLSLLLLSSCNPAPQQESEASSSEATEANGLSQTELEKGIGPIQTVMLSEIDTELAGQGEEIFNTKCVACHRFGQRYVGPALDSVLTNRTPEFVMNMMLNPQEMVEKHPDVKEMLATYLTPMPNQNLTEQDARAVLEYIRLETEKIKG